MGLHSRIARAAEVTEAHAHIGNLYVNRAMIGAVVGSQPFGGERLSGTGPTAGRPHYLFRLVAEPAGPITTPRGGGNASLPSLAAGGIGAGGIASFLLYQCPAPPNVAAPH